MPTSCTILPLRKTAFLSHLYIKTNILPRQARDKHRENSKKDAVFRTAQASRWAVRLRARLAHRRRLAPGGCSWNSSKKRSDPMRPWHESLRKRLFSQRFSCNRYPEPFLADDLVLHNKMAFKMSLFRTDPFKVILEDPSVAVIALQQQALTVGARNKAVLHGEGLRPLGDNSGGMD